MRRFFYDTEFIEHETTGPYHNKVPTIDLISIGIVSEDGKEFCAVSKEFNLGSASNNDFLRMNVLGQLPNAKKWIARSTIKQKVLDFLHPSGKDPVRLYAYFADYDHVALCWLFGRMIDLPKGMPMYTLDLKQLMVHLNISKKELPEQSGTKHNALADAKWNREVFLFLKDYAKKNDYNLVL